MKQIVLWMQGFALAIGGPGLFIISFLDSSFLSLPEITDLLIIWMVTQHPHRMPYYAAMSTAGSIAGCLVLYYVARKGGKAFLRKRFHERHVDRGLALFQRFGLLVVLIPSLLPPPAPFKIFVLLAGVAAVSPATFSLAIAIGRGIRYFGEGLLAVWYGEAAIDYVRANGKAVSLGLAIALTVGALGYALWRRLQSSRAAGL